MAACASPRIGEHYLVGLGEGKIGSVGNGEGEGDPPTVGEPVGVPVTVPVGDAVGERFGVPEAVGDAIMAVKNAACGIVHC